MKYMDDFTKLTRAQYADALDKWINDYTSYSIDWLSQTIDAVIVSCGKVIPLNDEKTFVESPATLISDITARNYRHT